MSITKKLKKTIRKAIIKDGIEQGDPVSRCGIQTGIKRPMSQEEKFRLMLAQAIGSNQEEQQDIYDETDFDIDEPDILSPYEQQAHVFDMTPEHLADTQGDETIPPSSPTSTDEGDAERAPNAGEASPSSSDEQSDN